MAHAFKIIPAKPTFGNLITKLDLTDVPVILPTTITTVTDPYKYYNIDPSGNLFGNTICGIDNWEKYMVYDASYNTLNPGHINNL